MDINNGSLENGYILDQKYSIKKILGIGGFGRTYLAESIWTGEDYAIKEYFPNDWAVRNYNDSRMILMPKDGERKELFAHGLSIFVDEAKILRGLSDDDAVVDVKDFFYENNTGYIVMEYVRGDTLANFMKKRKSVIDPDVAEAIIISVAKSMSKIHSLSLLHRDISPDNIMIQPDGKVKLIDFGATRIYALDKTVDMSVMIKPGFAPMEQYSKSGKQGPWTDVYALAATYYFIVSGNKPLIASDRYAGVAQPQLWELNSYISKEVSDVIEHAMEPDYKKRIQTMDAFAAEFEKAYRHISNDVYPHIMLNINGRFKKWKFLSGIVIKIGRAESECDICIEEPDVSRVHCEVVYDNALNQFKVTDLSKNGTYTRSGLIGKSKYVMLNTGETFYLVDESIKFYLEVR